MNHKQLQYLLLFSCMMIAKSQANVKVIKSFGNDHHPQVLHVQVKVPGEKKVTMLHLQKTNKFDKLPLTLAENKKESKFYANMLSSTKNYAHYQDTVRNAALYVKKSPTESTGKFTGHFVHKGLVYSVSPTESNSHKINLEKSRLPNKKDMHINVAKKIEARIMDKPKHIRRARQVQEYKVEVMLALDWTVWNFFNNRHPGNESGALSELKAHYSYIVHAMDLALRNMQTIQISLECINVRVAKTQQDSPWIDAPSASSTPSAETTLNSFIAWIPSSGVTADHYMAFTKTNFKDSDGSGDIAGLANVGTVCGGKNAASINEDNSFTAWATSAHELGHGLGADHDSTYGCDESQMFLMRGVQVQYTMTTLPNAFKYSSCSEQKISETINGLSNNCLNVDNGNPDSSYAQNIQPGKMYTADELCKIMKPTSPGLFVTTENQQNSETICASMYCQDNGNPYSGTSVGPAPVGVLCNSQKVCTFNGACEHDSTAETRPAGCFWGNTASDEECNSLKQEMETYPEYKDYYCPYMQESCCTYAAQVC